MRRHLTAVPRHLPLLLLAATAVLALAGPALAIPTPLPQGAAPYPSALPTAFATLGPGVTPADGAGWLGAASAALGWGAWVLNHWRELGELIALVVALVTAFRTYQWNQLVRLAGDLTFAVATLTNFDNDVKRRLAERELYNKAPAFARAWFTEAQFALAVETGWKLIAKPRLEAKA